MDTAASDILLVQGFAETPEGLALVANKQPWRLVGDWLVVFADLAAPAREDPGALTSVFAADLRHRVMKARFPVVDLVSAEPGAPVLRLAAGAVPWVGLKGAGLSSPINLLTLLGRLPPVATLSHDLAFTGIGPTSDPAGPLPEGAEVQRTRIFDGYVRDLARRFQSGARPAPLSPLLAPPLAPPKSATLIATLGLDSMESTSPPVSRLSRASWVGLVMGVLVALSVLVGHRARELLAMVVPAIFWGLAARELGTATERFGGYREARLAGLTGGHVRVSGLSAGSLSLRTPVTELPCLLVRWQIAVLDGKRLRTVERGDRRAPFELEEAPVRVRVLATEAALELEPIRSGRERVSREWVLVAGVPVVIWGVARRTADGARELVAHVVADARNAERIGRLPLWHSVVLGGAGVFGLLAVVGLFATLLHR